MLLLCTRCANGWVVESRICNREVAGSNLSRGYFAPRSTQPSSPLGSVNEYKLRLGRQRQVWLIPIVDKRVGVQVELWDPWEHAPYLSASAVVIHYEEALYQVCAPLPLPSLLLPQWTVSGIALTSTSSLYRWLCWLGWVTWWRTCQRSEFHLTWKRSCLNCVAMMRTARTWKCRMSSTICLSCLTTSARSLSSPQPISASL